MSNEISESLNNSGYTLFSQAIDLLNLDQSLTNGPFTIFVPNDVRIKAFLRREAGTNSNANVQSKITDILSNENDETTHFKKMLENLVKFHIVNGLVSNVSNNLKSMNSNKIIKKNQIRIVKPNVVSNDKFVIHEIDDVLIPNANNNNNITNKKTNTNNKNI